MDTKALRQKILDLAIHGKLVPQDPNDEPASVLLERIRSEKERLIKEGKIKKSKKSTKASDTTHYGNVPFEIPNSWMWTTLGEVGSWQSGGTPSRSNKTYYSGNIPWLKTGDLNDGLISYIPESITEEAVANSSAKINPTGSVLIAMYGATIGKLGILTFPATTNQACCACIEFNAIIQLYLFYFLLSQRNEFITKGGGGAQPNISKEIIVNTFIPLPPLSEQQRIVMEIEKWFALIDQIEQGKEDLQTSIKQTKSKILDLAIHGKLVPQDPNDEPASVLLERIHTEKERLIKEGKIKKSKKSAKASSAPNYENVSFEVPEGWVWSKLEDFINEATDFVASGSFASLKENVKYYAKPEYAILVRTKDFQNNFTKDLVYTDKHGYEFLSNSNLFGGELILPNIGASIGKVFIVPYLQEKMTIAPNSIMIRCYKDTHKEWLQYLFLSPFGQEQLRIISSSTAQGKFNKTDLRSLGIPIPPLAEQRRIVQKIEELFSVLDDIQKALEV